MSLKLNAYHNISPYNNAVLYDLERAECGLFLLCLSISWQEIFFYMMKNFMMMKNTVICEIYKVTI